MNVFLNKKSLGTDTINRMLKRDDNLNMSYRMGAWDGKKNLSKKSRKEVNGKIHSHYISIIYSIIVIHVLK